METVDESSTLSAPAKYLTFLKIYGIIYLENEERLRIAVVVFGQHLEKSDTSDFSGLVAQRQRYMAKDHASVGSNPTEPTNFIRADNRTGHRYTA